MRHPLARLDVQLGVLAFLIGFQLATVVRAWQAVDDARRRERQLRADLHDATDVVLDLADGAVSRNGHGPERVFTAPAAGPAELDER